MIHAIGDIFALHTAARSAGRRAAIVIPTNGIVKSNGSAVMGAGLALIATRRFADLPITLGAYLRKQGNHVHCLDSVRGIFSFPTKHDWRNDSSLSLIEQSAHELARAADPYDTVYLPRVGSGCGRLSAIDVERSIAPILASDRFVLVSLPR